MDEQSCEPVLVAREPSVRWPADLPDGKGPSAEEHLDYLNRILRIIRERDPATSSTE